jgi:hypothetical protein
MKRILLKTILIALTFVVGMIIFSIMKINQSGVIPMWIVAAGMFAGIGAIWKYQPKSNEIDLKKDD